MDVTVVKDWRGQEEIHRTGCADLKKSRNRPYRLAEAMTLTGITNLGEIYAVYWDCIADESVAAGDYPTLQHCHRAWEGEFTVKPCASALEPMPDPDGEPASAPVTKSEAKNDLARRLVLAAESMVQNLEDSDMALGALSREEAAQFVANWLHSLPTGGRGSERWWESKLPFPATADWK